jgi:hypothetical protein
MNDRILGFHSFQVQVRQKAENKKTFYYLEQLILKHKAHEHTLGIKPIHGKYCAQGSRIELKSESLNKIHLSIP